MPGVELVTSPKGFASAMIRSRKISVLVTRIIILNLLLSFLSPSSLSTKFLKSRIKNNRRIGISQNNASGFSMLLIITYKSPLSLM